MNHEKDYQRNTIHRNVMRVPMVCGVYAEKRHYAYRIYVCLLCYVWFVDIV